MKKDTLTIRDSFAEINGDKTVYDLPSGSLDIIAQDGRTLFSIKVVEEGTGIEVYAGSTVKVNRELFSESVSVRPRSSNIVHILRTPDMQGNSLPRSPIYK